jgi:hypothetical protein
MGSTGEDAQTERKPGQDIHLHATLVRACRTRFISAWQRYGRLRPTRVNHLTPAPGDVDARNRSGWLIERFPLAPN